MSYCFRNFIMEGGGVKGIACVGAMEVMEEKGILQDIKRVGGTSAGAINAILLGMNYSTEETKEHLWNMDFNKFKDDSWFFARDMVRFISEYGWYKGDYFRGWIGDLIKIKTGDGELTFQDLHNTGEYKDLYFITTNLSTRFAEVLSFEHTPTMKVADAVRMSMSIPFFFTGQKRKDDKGLTNIYVDGGVLDNYPVKLFDRKDYVEKAEHCRDTEYYGPHNAGLDNPYMYNKETLGFRLDSSKAIDVFRGGEPEWRGINNLLEFTREMIFTFYDAQDSYHLHSDDWQRTVYIDTLGIKTTEFDLSDEKKQALLDSGRKGAKEYFTWYDNPTEDVVNR